MRVPGSGQIFERPLHLQISRKSAEQLGLFGSKVTLWILPNPCVYWTLATEEIDAADAQHSEDVVSVFVIETMTHWAKIMVNYRIVPLSDVGFRELRWIGCKARETKHLARIIKITTLYESR